MEREAYTTGLIDTPTTDLSSEVDEAAIRRAIINRAHSDFVADMISDFTAKDTFTLTPEQLALARELVELNFENIPETQAFNRRLIIDKYGFEGEEPLSNRELEEKYGLKKGKARKLLGKARMFLRSPGRLSGLSEALGINEDNFGRQKAA